VLAVEVDLDAVTGRPAGNRRGGVVEVIQRRRSGHAVDPDARGLLEGHDRLGGHGLPGWPLGEPNQYPSAMRRSWTRRSDDEA
jgi:hypothetical protein